jgi:hypothetical protein
MLKQPGIFPIRAALYADSAETPSRLDHSGTLMNSGSRGVSSCSSLEGDSSSCSPKAVGAVGAVGAGGHGSDRSSRRSGIGSGRVSADRLCTLDCEQCRLGRRLRRLWRGAPVRRPVDGGRHRRSGSAVRTVTVCGGVFPFGTAPVAVFPVETVGVFPIGTDVGRLVSAANLVSGDGVIVAGTGADRDSFGEVELVAGAGPAVWSGYASSCPELC